MSDILPEGATDGAQSDIAPKKPTRRKLADSSAAPKPRKTPVRKKSEVEASQVPEVSSDLVAKPAVVRKKRTVKTSPPLVSEESPVIAPSPSVEPAEERKRPYVRRVSIKRAVVADNASSEESEKQAPEQAIKFVREEVGTRISAEEASNSSNQERMQGDGRRFQKKQKFQKNFNRPNGNGRYENSRNENTRNENRRPGGRNDQFKQRRENFRDARSSNQDNAPRSATPMEMGPPEEVDGLFELTPKGFGFLRTQSDGFEQSRDAVYVSNDMVLQHGLRHAVWIRGIARRHSRGIQLTEISDINGASLEESRNFPHFDELKAVNPNKRIAFETTPERYTTRTLDLVAPVGRGQRGLIVSPPRAGKTTFLQHIAEAVVENHSDSLHLMILLIDERPEEVTEFKRNIKGAEIYASSNDGKVSDHCRLAELCIERAKRLVEGGKHVFLLVDSITRLSRAYNNADRGSGRTMSGGIDARALEMPRRLFAAARNTRNAGSLTILATALVETNSRMDDLIFQEFKGTGYMELVLNRRIAEQYIYPAVDILKSGTRREELILPEAWLSKIHLIRRALAGHKPVEAMERFLFFLRKYPNNVQMLLDLKQRV